MSLTACRINWQRSLKITSKSWWSSSWSRCHPQYWKKCIISDSLPGWSLAVSVLAQRVVPLNCYLHKMVYVLITEAKTSCQQHVFNINISHDCQSVSNTYGPAWLTVYALPTTHPTPGQSRDHHIISPHHSYLGCPLLGRTVSSTTHFVNLWFSGYSNTMQRPI